MRREAGRVVFNQVAEIYDEARPAYPDQLIEDLLALSDFPAGGKIRGKHCIALPGIYFLEVQGAFR